MQSSVCGAPCVSVSLTKPNKQTNKAIPSPTKGEQTDSAVSLFSTFCISVSYFHIFAGCLSIVLRQIPLPVPCILTVICSQAGCARSNCLPAYPFDTFSHLSSRLLLALIAFPSASSLGCLIYCAVSLIASLLCAAQPTFDIPSKFAFYAQHFYRFMNYAPGACERARQLATRRIHNAPNDVSSTAGIIAFYGFSIAAICPLECPANEVQ